MKVIGHSAPRRRFGAWGALALLALVFAGERIYAGGQVPRMLDWVGHVPRATSVPTELPRVSIDLPHKSLQLIRYQREQKLNMVDVPFEFARGRIAVDDGPQQSMRLRLKGDRLMHIEDDERWSFRVKMRNSAVILGLRSFSLQRPETRNYAFEWLFHKVLSQEGFPALAYRFVNLEVNGKDLGVYALEEHFDKHVLERNNFREGPILRFVEAYVAPDLSRAAIAPFRSKSWQTGARRDMVERAIVLLDEFRAGQRTVSEVFDRAAMARFFAITDVLGMRHAAVWKSMRFYYNPLTATFLPIGFDGHHGMPDMVKDLSAELGHGGQEQTWLHTKYGPWFNAVFARGESFDLEFFASYVAELERLCALGWLAELRAQHESTIEGLYAAMERYGPLRADEVFQLGDAIHEFSFTPFVERCRAIPRRLAPAGVVHAYLDDVSADSVRVSVQNASTLPIEILGLEHLDERFEPRAPALFMGRSETEPVWNAGGARIIEFAGVPAGLDPLTVRYRVPGSGQSVTTEVRPFRRLGPDAASKLLAHLAPGAPFPCSASSAPGTCVVDAGAWVISSPVALPADTALVVRAGATLQLREAASLLVRGPVTLEGTADSPIRLTSPNRDAGGLLVLADGAQSSLRHVIIEHLGEPGADRAPGVTGAVTFYESPVTLDHVSFASNRSEDALNVVRGKVTCRACRFERIPRDAIDVDFGELEISDSTFVDVGNDGIDVSGTRAVLSRITMERIGDKALSAGEASHATVGDLTVRKADIGLASKDQSTVIADDVKLHDVNRAVAVYQKKPEFGPAELRVRNLRHEGGKDALFVEQGSRLVVDDQTIEPPTLEPRSAIHSVTPTAAAP